jgi:hypothetical protein
VAAFSNILGLLPGTASSLRCSLFFIAIKSNLPADPALFSKNSVSVKTMQGVGKYAGHKKSEIPTAQVPAGRPVRLKREAQRPDSG